MNNSGTNLSPTFYAGPNGSCFLSINKEILETLECDFLILQRKPNPYSFKDFENDKVGHKIWWVNDFHKEGCRFNSDFEEQSSQEPCNAASLIDVVTKLENLVEFLGIQPIDAIVAEK